MTKMTKYLVFLITHCFFMGQCVSLKGQKIPNRERILTQQPKSSAMGIAEPWREEYFSGQPLRIGNKVQFLFDDHVVEDRFGLHRIVGPLVKSEKNPLNMGPDMPWETNTTSWGGAYLRDIIFDPIDKLFKGWYLVYRYQKGIETGYNYSTLYAESEDGVNWRKPELDYFLIDGRKTNYVLHKKDGGTALMESVYLDEAATDPGRRFVALVKMIPPDEKERCIVLFYSPDGKKWTLANDPVLFRGANDGSYSLVRDSSRNRWLIYRRPPSNALVSPGLGAYRSNPMNHRSTGMNSKRRISVSVSNDMKNWSYPRGISILDELDDSNVSILGNGMDIDQFSIIKYGDIYLGIINTMDNLTMTSPRDCQLMWSRDGFRWERLPTRLKFIENGLSGEWDGGSILSFSMIPKKENLIQIYYSGGNTTQGEKRISTFSGTGIAFIGKDRFIGYQAGPAGGYLLTRQFIVEGSRLEINFSSHAKHLPTEWGSLIKAELLQPGEEHYGLKPYPGFTIEDCDSITVGESFNQVITWRGSSDLSSLKGKLVYIRFYLQNNTLYTFRLAD